MKIADYDARHWTREAESFHAMRVWTIYEWQLETKYLNLKYGKDFNLGRVNYYGDPPKNWWGRSLIAWITYYFGRRLPYVICEVGKRLLNRLHPSTKMISSIK